MEEIPNYFIIECNKATTGKYGCFYTFVSEEDGENTCKWLHTLDFTVRNYSNDDAGVAMSPSSSSTLRNALCSANDRVSIKAFHVMNVERERDMILKQKFLQEVKQIRIMRDEVYSKSEFTKWSTIKEIMFHNGESGFAFGITPNKRNTKIQIKVQQHETDKLINLAELYFITVSPCENSIDALFNTDWIHSININTLFTDIKTSLDMIHAKNYVHRDIKPQNIVYCPNDIIKYKLIDYGFVNKAGGQLLTGTPYYMGTPFLTRMNKIVLDVCLHKEDFNKYFELEKEYNKKTNKIHRMQITNVGGPKKLYSMIQTIFKDPNNPNNPYIPYNPKDPTNVNYLNNYKYSLDVLDKQNDVFALYFIMAEIEKLSTQKALKGKQTSSKKRKASFIVSLGLKSKSS
jgi:serine/threonine protein kinase